MTATTVRANATALPEAEPSTDTKAMTDEKAMAAIKNALEERKLMLERKLVTTPPECRAAIVEDIGACRSLLARVDALDAIKEART